MRRRSTARSTLCGLSAALALGAVMVAPGSTAVSAAPYVDWTRFGFTASRTSVGPAQTGITAANVGHLRRQQVQLDGTADSSPIYLHAVTIRGAQHDAFFVTTTYGRTEAIDASTGKVLWRYTPPGFSSWAGSYRITTATPVADRSRTWIYAASPNGRIQKLAVSDGHAAWRTAITLLPEREKIAASLNYWRGRVIATTGGYIGDQPPYQGHVAVLDAASGKLLHVWNSLCSNRHLLQQPSTCPGSDSAIWGRAGAVVVPATGDLLVATGNAPWDGRANWGDSALKLSPDASRLLGNWTPTNESELNSNDVDLGSTSPALIGGRYLVQGGKDGLLRLLSLARMNGTAAAGARKGGELQTVKAPGPTDVFTAPAVWGMLLFVADNAGTAAWRLRAGRLHRVWQNGNPGTSPVVAGGLLYVYDPGGGLAVYLPRSGKRIAVLATGSGHWNSPIAVDGRIALPEGDANDHRQSGVLDIWRS
jgi:outer membrane protein assembly factor BamB